jgi:hypothetical protein
MVSLRAIRLILPLAQGVALWGGFQLEWHEMEHAIRVLPALIFDRVTILPGEDVLLQPGTENPELWIC